MLQLLYLAFVAHRTVDYHPYQPYQRRDTNNAVHNAAGNRGRAKYKRNKVETKDSNQTPVQGTDNRQWHQHKGCQSSHLFFLLFKI